MRARNSGTTRWFKQFAAFALGIGVVAQASAITINLQAEKPTVPMDKGSWLSWQVQGAKYCRSAGGWSGGRGLNGRYHTGPLTQTTWYQITCYNGAEKKSAAVTVAVADGGSGGGGGGGGGGALAVDILADPQVIARDSGTTLRWTSQGASSCRGAGAWSGSKPLNGSAGTGNLSREKNWYKIICTDGQREVSDFITVVTRESGGSSPGGSPEVSVTIDADPLQVPVNGSSNLTWRSQGADACTSSGGWSGGRGLNGTYNTGALSQNTVYRITCQSGSANAVASVTVAVGSDSREAVVRWQAPTRNTDGSNLTDLAGYVVYWGRQSRNYTSSQRINNPDATVWRRDLAADRYVVAMTAVDNQGNESVYSNEVVLDLR